MILSLIVAADESNGIGKNNELLCHLPADLQYFKRKTTGHHILMGRLTYESIGKALPNRVNLVISRNHTYQAAGCVVLPGVQQAIDYAQLAGEEELFVTGGGTIYNETLSFAHRIYLTRIHHRFQADTFFPELPSHEWKLMSRESHTPDEKHAFAFSFEVWERQN